MWRSYGPVIDTTDLHFDHEIDLMTKESGSGVYLYTQATGKRVIYGIQSTHSTVSLTWNTPPEPSHHRYPLMFLYYRPAIQTSQTSGIAIPSNGTRLLESTSSGSSRFVDG